MTTPRPAERGGPLTRGLNWLLNTLLTPAENERPRNRPSSRPTTLSHNEPGELLSRQPTRVTPVVFQEYTTTAPVRSTRAPQRFTTANTLQVTPDLANVIKKLQAQSRPGTQQKPELSADEISILLREVKKLQSNPNLLKNLEAAFGKKFTFDNEGQEKTSLRTTRPTTRTTTSRTTTTTTTTTTRPPTTRPTFRSRKSTTKIPELSQSDIAFLIKQIQAAQQDPSAAKNIDISKLIGAGSPTEKYLSSTSFPDDFLNHVNKSPTSKPSRSPKYEPVYQSSPRPQSGYKDDVSSSAPKRPTLPPVAFRPVNGVPEGEGMLRGRLVNAAVSVTRSISRFLSNAFQVNPPEKQKGSRVQI